MTTLEKIFEMCPEDEFMKAEGFDEAVVGVEMSIGKLVYSYDKMIEILARDMTVDEAEEYFDYNIADASVGEKTPIYIKLVN